MSLENVFLRALEPTDIDDLLLLENNSSYWKYANRTEPFSRNLLLKYIEQQCQDIYEVKQKRFVISQEHQKVLGFVDLFDFEPLHRRAGVGIIIRAEDRGQGIGKQALKLVTNYAQNHLNMHCLYANIAIENLVSLRTFEACGFRQIGLKKAWNFYQDQFHDEYLYQKLF